MEFKSLNSLILAEVEESGFLFDVPLSMGSDSRVFGSFVIGDFLSIAEFLGFFDSAFRPGTCCHIVGCLERSGLTEQVLANSRELLGGTALEKHDFVGLWHLHQGAQIRTSGFGNFSESF